MSIDNIYHMCDSLNVDCTFFVYREEDDYYECSKRHTEYRGLYEFMPSHLAVAPIEGFKFSKDQETVFVLLA